MTSNIPVRVPSAGELTKLRGNKQLTKLKLAIWQPATIYTARVNQTFTGSDGIAQLTYDGGSGTLANVTQGMTIFIGSSSGAFDKGICRVRKTPTSTILYINETSEIAFADNDYITIVDSFSLWQRDSRLAGGTVFMDYDIQYGTGTPTLIPRVGPTASVLVSDGTSNVSFAPPSPALSASYDGASVASYSFTASGATNTSGMTTTGPSWEYPAGEAQYRWQCAVTDDENRSVSTERFVFVDPPDIPFRLLSCFGSFDDGGWQFDVAIYADIAQTAIYDRALVVLYADDYYQDVSGSIGRLDLAGYKNVVAIGWVDGETIFINSETNEVTFSVYGAAHWFDKLRALPFELTHTTAAPTTWKEIQDMTVDKALAQLLQWTTTATRIMDCFLTGDTNEINIIAQPAGTIKDQLKAIATDKLFAHPLVNSYNQLYIEIDPQIADSTARSGFTTVMAIGETDRAEEITLERRNVTQTSMIELGGSETYNGSAEVLVYSRAPGNIGKQYGYIEAPNGYVFADQDECNRVAGALLAVQNYEYEHVDIPLAQNNRMFDIAPRMYGTLTITAADNARGIGFTNRKFYPRRVAYNYDPDAGTMTTSLFVEFETTGVDGVTYYPPSPVVLNNVSSYGGSPISFPGIDDWFPPVVFPTVTEPCNGIGNSYGSAWDEPQLDGGIGPLTSRIYLPCKIRATGGSYPTSLEMHGTWWGDAATNYNVYGIKDGVRVVTATVTTISNYLGTSYNTATFAPVSDTEVDGFEIVLTSGLGASVTYTPLNVIASGSAAATDSTGTPVSVVSGQYYCVDATAGSFDPDGAGVLPSVSACNFYNIAQAHTEQYSGALYRIFHLATGSSHNVTVADSPGNFADNTGGPVSWVVRNVDAKGRRIDLGQVTVRNVCAI